MRLALREKRPRDNPQLMVVWDSGAQPEPVTAIVNAPGASGLIIYTPEHIFHGPISGGEQK